MHVINYGRKFLITAKNSDGTRYSLTVDAVDEKHAQESFRSYQPRNEIESIVEIL